jgi:hypothetical protein
MDIFRTEVKVPKSDLSLTLHDKVVTVGSCFAEVIGSKLQQNKVDVLPNPFGTIFNPISVCQLLKAAAGIPYDFEKSLVQHNNIWYAYDLHSSISSPSKEGLLEEIQTQLSHTHKYLQDSSLLIITLGTAVAYQLIQTGSIVANCHKLPAKNFNRLLLNMDEIMPAFEEMYGMLKQVNPKLKLLLTVSPVRHVKETLTMSSVSKSQLRLLCHYLQQSHPDILYFPAYEIMMDDLRDYRFYKDDMLHPTTLAEDYIWEKFMQAYYDNTFQNFTVEWNKVNRALAHKPFHPASESHQSFLKSTNLLLEQLASKYKIDVSAEQNALKRKQNLH